MTSRTRHRLRIQLHLLNRLTHSRNTLILSLTTSSISPNKGLNKSHLTNTLNVNHKNRRINRHPFLTNRLRTPNLSQQLSRLRLLLIQTTRIIFNNVKRRRRTINLLLHLTTTFNLHNNLHNNLLNNRFLKNLTALSLTSHRPLLIRLNTANATLNKIRKLQMMSITTLILTLMSQHHQNQHNNGRRRRQRNNTSRQIIISNSIQPQATNSQPDVNARNTTATTAP